MFRYFLLTIVLLYLAYYLVILLMDVKALKREGRNKSEAREIDISKAVESYQAQDASAIIKNTLKGGIEIPEVKNEETDMDEDYSNEEPAISDEDVLTAGGESNLPFEIGDEAADSDKTGNGGLGNSQAVENSLEKEKAEEETEKEYAPIEHSSGVGVVALSNLFEKANLQDSLFKDIRLSA